MQPTTGIRQGFRIAGEWFLSAFHPRIDRWLACTAQHAIRALCPWDNISLDIGTDTYAADIHRTCIVENRFSNLVYVMDA